jgi:hypothetical protein
MINPLLLQIVQSTAISNSNSQVWFQILSFLYLPLAYCQYLHIQSTNKYKNQKQIKGLVRTHSNYSVQRLNPNVLIGTVLDCLSTAQKIKISDSNFSFESKLKIQTNPNIQDNLSIFEVYKETVLSCYKRQFTAQDRKFNLIDEELKEEKRFGEFCDELQFDKHSDMNSDTLQLLLMVAGASMGALYDKTRLALGVIYVIQYIELKENTSNLISSIDAQKVISLCSYLVPEQIEIEYYSNFKNLIIEELDQLKNSNEITNYVVNMFDNPD